MAIRVVIGVLRTSSARADLIGALGIITQRETSRNILDPNAFAVVNGKLYVSYSTAVRARWRVDRDGNITKAAGNWPGRLAQALPKKPTGR